jgi:Tol biopolymer transport system component
VLAPDWRPTGHDLIYALASPDQRTTTLFALPLGGGAPRALLVAAGDADQHAFHFTSDAEAFAISLRTSDTSSRIAVWEIATETTRWLTPDLSAAGSPVWSPDGRFVYFVGPSDAPRDLAVIAFYRIGADGSDTRIVYHPDRNGDLAGVTPDGRGLIWTRQQAGGSTDVVDIASGKNVGFDVAGASGSIAWRATRPRALVMSGGCCAGPGGGSLILWDDLAGTRTPLVEQSRTVAAAGSADWDPTGSRIAATIYDRSTLIDVPPTLVSMDATGSDRVVIPNTDGASWVRWLPEGILFARAFPRHPNSEIVLTSANGQSQRVLYQSSSYPLLVGIY